MVDVWLWLPLSLLGLNYSANTWKNARRGHLPAFSEHLIAVATGYFVWNFGSEVASLGRLGQAAFGAFCFTAATPITASLWIARDYVSRLLIRVGWFTAGCVGSLWYVPLEIAPVAGFGVLLLASVTPRLYRWGKARWQTRHWRRAEQLQERPRETPTRPEDQQLITELQKQVAKAEQEGQQHQQALEQHRATTANQREKLQRRRQEILVHVQQIRSEQRAALQKGILGLHYHPSSYGFLLAEASRVLRSEIQAGQRTPAIEADPFLFDVVERLIAADDFEERYFHRAGARAVTAVERYLTGEQPLPAAQQIVRRQKLTPGQLAPGPLKEPLADSLLETWLEPHRTFQRQQWQLFTAKRHPDQARLSDFLRTRSLEPPGEAAWQSCWDESPAPFVGKNFERTFHSRTISKSKIWGWRS